MATRARWQEAVARGVTVHIDQCLFIGAHLLTVEARALGLPRAHWPRAVVLDGLSSGTQTARFVRVTAGGDVHIYRSPSYELHIMQ